MLDKNSLKTCSYTAVYGLYTCKHTRCLRSRGFGARKDDVLLYPLPIHTTEEKMAWLLYVFSLTRWLFVLWFNGYLILPSSLAAVELMRPTTIPEIYNNFILWFCAKKRVNLILSYTRTVRENSHKSLWRTKITVYIRLGEIGYSHFMGGKRD